MWNHLFQIWIFLAGGTAMALPKFSTFYLKINQINCLKVIFRPGGGGGSWNFWWGCAARDIKSQPSPRVTWSLKIDQVPEFFLKGERTPEKLLLFLWYFILRLAKLRSAFDYFVPRVAPVKTVLWLSVFLEYNLDLGYFASDPCITLVQFVLWKDIEAWFLVNFGLLSVQICPGPIYSYFALFLDYFVLSDVLLANQVYSEYLILPQFWVVLC